MGTQAQEEVWRQSPLAPPHVEVSNLGRVRTLPRIAAGMRGGHMRTQRRAGAMLSPWIAKHGYPTVSIKVGGDRPKYLVHRLVAAAFCCGYAPELSVNHINGIKTDNRAENLEWVTLAKNTEIQWRDGLVDLRGEGHPLAKLSADQVRHIRKALAQGGSVTTIARMLCVSVSTIYKIGARSRWAGV